jgi:hypothetical protein
MTDTDVTFLPNYNNMDLARLYVRERVLFIGTQFSILYIHDSYLPSVPASLQALGRVECAMAFSITPPDSSVASPRVITFPTLSVSLDTKIGLLMMMMMMSFICSCRNNN